MTNSPSSSTPVEQSERQRWMGLLARADTAELTRLWGSLDEPVAHRALRRPETGLVQLRGRIGGTGAAFNLGEAPVTRCSVLVENRLVGHAYVLGRDARHAEIAALLDALLQDPDRQGRLVEAVVRPLERSGAARRAERKEAAESTRVDFFTLVRGETVK